MKQAAAELYGSRCRIVAVDSEHPGGVAARAECALDDRASGLFREFRRAHDLAQSLRVILWPGAAEPGVTAIDERPGPSVRPPSTLAIRERVVPLVRGGFRVTAVCRPHEALAELALQEQVDLAITLALHNDGGCVSVACEGVPGPTPGYLRWDAGWCAVTAGSGDELARYQFAASLSPHLHRLLGELPAGSPRILACGSMTGLRTAMAPLSEEFGRDVEVLDHPWAGMLDTEAGTHPTEPAKWQLVRAAAQAAADKRR